MLLSSARSPRHFRRDDEASGVQKAKSVEELGRGSQMRLLFHVPGVVLKGRSHCPQSFAAAEQFCAQKLQELRRKIVSWCFAVAGDEVFRRKVTRHAESRKT